MPSFSARRIAARQRSGVASLGVRIAPIIIRILMYASWQYRLAASFSVGILPFSEQIFDKARPIHSGTTSSHGETCSARKGHDDVVIQAFYDSSGRVK